MTIREKLANWLTNGDYEAHKRVRKLNYEHMQKAWVEIEEYEKALQEIAGTAITESSNGTLKRVVRIAQVVFK